MKTIKLHYRVKNYLYPFKTVIVIFQTQRVNIQTVQKQYSKIYKSLILSQDETKLFQSFTSYQKMRFCVEHKKVVQTRKDFIGVNNKQHAQYFQNKLLTEQPKRITEYRKYLMEIGQKNKEIFFIKNFDTLLQKTTKNQQILQTIDYIHIIELFIQEQCLINLIEPFVSRIIKIVLNKIQLPNLQIKRRGFRIIAQLCSYYQTSYPYIFLSQSEDSSNRLNHIFKQVQTHNLFLTRIVLKFIVSLMYCATKTSNFMLIVVQCIQIHLLNKLHTLKNKLNDNSFKIYESFDQYTNTNELQITTTSLRVQKISIEKEPHFNQIKDQIFELIKNIENKFVEIESGKHKPKIQVQNNREELKKQYTYQEDDQNIIIDKQIDSKMIQVRHTINPMIHKRPRKRSHQSEFMKKSKYLDKMPITQKMMMTQIFEGYEYKLLQSQNQFTNYKTSIQQLLKDKDLEIEKLNKTNKKLQDKILILQKRLKQSIFFEQTTTNITTIENTSGGRGSTRKKSVYFKQTVVQTVQDDQPVVQNRVRNITKIFETKHVVISTTSLLPPPPPPPSPSSLISNLPPPPLLPPPPPIAGLGLPPPLPFSLSLTPKQNTNRKPKLQIKSQMKIISWNIFQLPDIKGSIWEQQQNIEIQISKIQQDFGQTSSSPVSKKISAVPTLEKKISFLNSDRAKMIQLILLKLKLHIARFDQICYQLDQQVLQYDTIISLLSILPLEIEIPLFNNKELEYNKLSIPDQFMYKICNIVGYQAKLRSLKFKIDYEQIIQQYTENVNYFKLFFTDLRNDKLFQLILKYALTIGNIMNNDTISKQGAYGFKIESLQKLIQTTTSNGKQSLLSYIIDVIKIQHQQLCIEDLIPQYNNKGKIVAFSVLQSDYSNINKKLSYVKRALVQINQQQHDISSQFFFKFYKDAKDKIDDVGQLLKDAERAFKQYQKYYIDKLQSERTMAIIIGFRDKIKKQLLN